MMAIRRPQWRSIARMPRGFYSTEGDLANRKADNDWSKVQQTVRCGLILSRIPIICRAPTKFEKAYYHYQSELERRLMWTFPYYYYFKKGSHLERKYMMAQKGPVTPQPGVWYPRGIPDIKWNRERRSKQEIILPTSTDTEDTARSGSDALSRPIVPEPCVTKADESNDLRALDRKLERTLYLVIHTDQGWKFPVFDMKGRERKSLHVTAEEQLRNEAGHDLHTWTVSNSPAAVLRYRDGVLVSGPQLDPPSLTDGLVREFYVKSHIIHGQVHLNGHWLDFAWLTKDEMVSRMDPEYFGSLQVLLSE